MSGYFVRLSSPQRWAIPAPVKRMPWPRRWARYLASVPEGWWYSLVVRWYNWHARAYFASYRIEWERCDDCGKIAPALLVRAVGNPDGTDARLCHVCRGFLRQAQAIRDQWARREECE